MNLLSDFQCAHVDRQMPEMGGFGVGAAPEGRPEISSSATPREFGSGCNVVGWAKTDLNWLGS